MTRLTGEKVGGVWCVVSEWRPVGLHSKDEVETKASSHRDAYLQGRQLACCRGALAVRVLAPGGAVAHEWARSDNRWHDRVPVPMGEP